MMEHKVWDDTYKVELMDEESAKQIVSWKYDPPYALYNMTDDNDREEESWDIEELMDGSYFTVNSLDNELIGFYCYGLNAQVPGGIKQGLYMGKDSLDIGLGLRPDLTGKGMGYYFVKKGLEFGQMKYAPTRFRLSVASFNQRAISLYQKIGFTHKETFINRNGLNEIQFLLMEKL